MDGVYEDWEKEHAIDALAVVHNHLYLLEHSIRHEIMRKMGYDIGPERVDLREPEKPEIEPAPCPLTPFEREVDQQMEHEIEPEHLPLHEVAELMESLTGPEPRDVPEREIDEQMEFPIGPEPWDVVQRELDELTYDFRQQRAILWLVSPRILYYARRAVKAGYMDEETRMEIAARAVVQLSKIKNHARLASETEDVDEQRPLKIHHTELPNHLNSKAFHELMESMNAVTLDELHEKRVEDLMFYDPKRKVRVPSRFCSFNLAGFDLDYKSIAPLGPTYQPGPSPPGTSVTEYVDAKTNAHLNLATSSIDVISIRVVRVGPDYTYPVEVYGKVIARDEIDYNCVYLFERARENAQTINSEKDMLALTGPYRALVTLGYVYFEFDLKIKGKGGPDDEVEFSKGVVQYYCNPDHNRIKLQLRSCKSLVKLVLQQVNFPVAASLEISVLNQEPSDPPVHFNGKITAGTSRDYRHHMLLYDSSVCRGGLMSGTGPLLLNRNLVAVNGYVLHPALVDYEKLVLYVCFLDASCEIEDKDEMDYEDDDDDDDEEYVYAADDDDDDDYVDEYADDDEEGAAEEKEEEVADEMKEEEVADQMKEEEADEEKDKEKEEDAKNIVTLKYPETETVGELGGHKLKVKVNWTAVLEKPEGADFFYRYCCLPGGLEPNYRDGGNFQ
ncbi:unnamed protein product [Alopecurus aequalis]